jgi:hypothetical protein
MTEVVELFSTLLPPLRALSRGEKIRLIQFLAEELAKEEDVPRLEPGASYPVWSPHDAVDAAVALQQLLDSETVKP